MNIPPEQRIASIDLLRGLVMVLMALDHTRVFFGGGEFNPRDITEPAVFLTRWITHLCAPTFILLAGIGAYLFRAQGRSTAEVSRFLLTRGLWLILIEFTLVRIGWTFRLDLELLFAQVIWAIGASMVVLAGLVYLPRRALAVLSLAVIVGHNLLDGIEAEAFGPAGWIWILLHEPGFLQPAPDVTVVVVYPLVPWVAVMAAGYTLGPLFQASAAERRRRLLALGGAVTLGFVVLRAINLYGDPAPWAFQGDWLATLLSFLNCEKYPPSLLFLMMTLGPGLLLLAAFEGARGRPARWLCVFGRVPFFFYVVHLYWIHALALGLGWLVLGDEVWSLHAAALERRAGYGLGLAGVYGLWLVVLVTLYPLCSRFAALKQTRHGWWWRYL